MTAETAIARREAHLRAAVTEAAAARALARLDEFSKNLVDVGAYRQALDEDMAAIRAMILAAIAELLEAAAAAPDDRAGLIAVRKAWRGVQQRIADRAAALAAGRPEHVLVDLQALEKDRR